MKTKVIADHTCNPAFVAADLLSQAEHGVDSQVVLVTVNLTPDILEAIETEVDKQAHALTRVDIVRQSIAKSVIVKSISVEEAIAFSNDYAPEHLILHLQNASSTVSSISNAGSVFVGPYSPERFGSHVLCLYSTHGCFQLWRLRLWNQSHAPNEWICAPIQWCEHSLLPETYHIPRDHLGWAQGAWPNRSNFGRLRRP
jgi:hypothetical protein